MTICTAERAYLFGTIKRGRMYVNALGKIVAEEWQRSETIRDRVHLNAFIIMPDHLHSIVVFADPDVDAPTCPRGYRAFGGWTDDGSDGAEKSTDSMNDGPGSTGVAGDPTGASNPEKASHGGATLRQSESDDGDPELHRPPRSLGSFTAGFKSAATTRINDHRDTPGAPVWQRN